IWKPPSQTTSGPWPSRLWTPLRGTAWSLTQLGRPDDALRALERAVELSPNDADLHHACSSVLERFGRRADALAAFERALELDPDGVAHWESEATALHALGKDQEAEEAAQRATHGACTRCVVGT